MKHHTFSYTTNDWLLWIAESIVQSRKAFSLVKQVADTDLNITREAATLYLSTTAPLGDWQLATTTYIRHTLRWVTHPTTHHVSSLTESHSHPSCSCALHIDIQESIISSVDGNPNKQITIDTSTTTRAHHLKAIGIRWSLRGHRVARGSSGRSSGL